MTDCQRFESEALSRFVADEPLDAHFDTCPDCRAARSAYEAMAAALKQARDEYSPPGDWEAKVWARIRRAEDGRTRLRWPAFLGAGAVAAVLAVLVANPLGGPDSLALVTNQLEHGTGAAVRASAQGDVPSGAPGAVLHLVVDVPRGKVGDVRVYRGANELVFQCATQPGCTHTRRGLEAHVRLDKTGTYRTLAIAADKELPAATGNLDTDYAAAMHTGAAKESAPLEVL
jgi:hypothetical protein